ncbi:MAG: hypothetical protein ACI8XO_003604 [Verrucomicrobiales bacterium]
MSSAAQRDLTGRFTTDWKLQLNPKIIAQLKDID